MFLVRRNTLSLPIHGLFQCRTLFLAADIDDDDDGDAAGANIRSCSFSRSGVDGDDVVPTPTKEQCNLFGKVMARFL